MPAKDRMDWLVEKAAEMGVASIQPLMSERSVLRLYASHAGAAGVARRDRRLVRPRGTAGLSADTHQLTGQALKNRVGRGRAAGGQPDRYRGTQTSSTGDTDFAAVQVDYFLHDAHAQTCSGNPAGSIRAIKAFEDPRQLLRRHPQAVVNDANSQRCRTALQRRIGAGCDLNHIEFNHFTPW